MSPISPKTDRNQLIERFHLSLKENSEIKSPAFLNIDPTGTIKYISESAQGLITEEWKKEIFKGNNFFELIPTKHLEEFILEISGICKSSIPGTFNFSYKNIVYNILLAPIFYEGVNLEIQVLLSKEKMVKPGKNNLEDYSAESEQQFINKLIKSLSKANDIKFGLSRMIRHISKFLSFEFGEAWEVGYDKHTLFKSAAFSKEDIAWNDEGIKIFKKGQGLPGITWESQKVEIWQDLPRNSNFLRKKSVLRNQLFIGIGVPIIYENEVIAILTYFTSNRVDIDKIRGILERISFQISIYVKRKITENQLNNMFRFSPNLIAVVGVDGFLKKVNPSFKRIFGYSEEKLLNTPFSQFLHSEDKKATYDRLKEVAGGLSPRPFQNRCLTSSGEYKWISWTPSELMEEEGVVHIFGLDISNIKKTHLELLQYRNIVESSKEGIGLYTLETGEIFLNRAFHEILGLPENEFQGAETIRRIYANNELAFNVFKTIIKGNFWEGDLQLKDQMGNFLDYYFSGGPIFNENNEIVAVFGIHTDISERKEFESSLKEYGTRINNVLESITDGFFSLNKAGEVTYWNKAAEELLQVSRDEILNKKLWDFFPIERDPIFYQKYREAINTDQKISFEHFVQFLDMWIEVNVYPGSEGLSSYFKDISGRKRVEEEIRIAQERYELVSKATREAVYDWDLSRNSLEWSDTYYEIYGYDRVAAKKSLLQWEQQLHKDDRERVIRELNTALKGGDSEWICEYKLIQANRKIAIILERGYIIRDEKGQPVRMIGALQDITTLKQDERALEELNHQLKKHSSELIQSNAELEQFAYIASHDLQEPLRMVTSFLTLLEKKYEDKLDDKARQYIHFATDGASRMRQIILDLLDYSRVGKLNYDLELVDVNVAIREITRLYENMIKEKNATIEFEDLPVIKAASTPLQRVLSNLISNGIKYSRENVPPLINISVKDIESHWEFQVRDNGIGIDKQFKEKIFIIFQRLHSRDQYSGTGIGLAISKKIVENHGGEIWVNSEEGLGSTFHFTIQKHF